MVVLLPLKHEPYTAYNNKILEKLWLILSHLAVTCSDCPEFLIRAKPTGRMLWILVTDTF